MKIKVNATFGVSFLTALPQLVHPSFCLENAEGCGDTLLTFLPINCHFEKWSTLRNRFLAKTRVLVRFIGLNFAVFVIV